MSELHASNEEKNFFWLTATLSETEIQGSISLLSPQCETEEDQNNLVQKEGGKILRSACSWSLRDQVISSV